MRAKKKTATDIQITQTDVRYMDIIDVVFEKSPQLVSGLPSINQCIKDNIDNLIAKNIAAPNLHELITNFGHSNAFSIISMLTAMLISILKNQISTRGKKQAVFIEEVHLMLQADSIKPMRIITGCMSK